MHREVTSAQPSTDSALQAHAALSVHPAADLFPLLEGEPYERFKADIAAHGLIEPIWLCDGQILDGRNRYRACRELGVEVRTRPYEGDSPVSHAWSLNGAKRHLLKSQLAAIAVEMLPALREEARKRQKATHLAGRDRDGNPIAASVPPISGEPTVDSSKHSGEAIVQAAKIVGVGKTIVTDAGLVKAADLALFEQVKAGAISVDGARKQIAKRSSDRRPSEAVTTPQNGKKPRAERIAEIRRLASEGNRASQIAGLIGVGEYQVRKIARDEHLTLPDAALGRTRKIRADHVIEATVIALEGCLLGLQALGDNFDGVGGEDARAWAEAMVVPLRALKKLQQTLLEIAR